MKNRHEELSPEIITQKSEIRPQKSGNHMHFAKANDVALTFAMACNKMCRRWEAVSKGLTENEREHMVHTKPPHERGGEREPFGHTWLMFCHRAQWMTYHHTTNVF